MGGGLGGVALARGWGPGAYCGHEGCRWCRQPRQAGFGRMASVAGVGHVGFRAPVGHRSGRTDTGFQRIPAGAETRKSSCRVD